MKQEEKLMSGLFKTHNCVTPKKRIHAPSQWESPKMQTKCGLYLKWSLSRDAFDTWKEVSVTLGC